MDARLTPRLTVPAGRFGRLRWTSGGSAVEPGDVGGFGEPAVERLTPPQEPQVSATSASGRYDAISP
jgi:hypothetical protein